MNAKVLKIMALAAALSVPVALAQDTGTTDNTAAATTNPGGTTGSGTPLVEDEANPNNEDPGTDWGWLGLAGLLGLGGLVGRKYVETQTVRDTTTNVRR